MHACMPLVYLFRFQKDIAPSKTLGKVVGEEMNSNHWQQLAKCNSSMHHEAQVLRTAARTKSQLACFFTERMHQGGRVLNIVWVGQPAIYC